MTEVPDDPVVADATVLSNFAAVDRMPVVTSLSGVCTTPVVCDEIERGVGNHSYLRSALHVLEREIPVVHVSESVANRESSISEHLDPGEAQALAVAEVHNGQLLTDDGDARAFAREHSVLVVGSVGILLAAVDDGRIGESTANEWLRTWIDEFGYYVPHRHLDEYR